MSLTQMQASSYVYPKIRMSWFNGRVLSNHTWCRQGLSKPFSILKQK